MTARPVLRLGTALAVVAGFLALAPRADAEVLNLTLDDNGNPVTYKPYGGNSVSINAGPFHWTQSSPSNTNYPNTFTTYCIDLDHFISKGSTYAYFPQTDLKVAPTIGDNAAKVGAITELFDHYYKNSLTSTANETAFQLALWELVYDGASSKSLGAGRIQASNTAAQNLLDSLGKSYSNHDLAGYQLVALVSKSGNQDQITVIPNPPVNGVPAPPGLVIAGMGFGCMLLGRLRFRRPA